MIFLKIIYHLKSNNKENIFKIIFGKHILPLERVVPLERVFYCYRGRWNYKNRRKCLF